MDYLVKPIAPARLRIACEKALEQLALRRSADAYLFLKVDGALQRVAVADIRYVEAANNYIRVHTGAGRLLVYQSLKGIEAQLPEQEFVQVHKSFLVARKYIQRIDGNSILVAPATRIPLSRRFKSSVLARLHLTNKSRPHG
jgi:DNA-binding LytR/AlgR family response regulator